MRLRDFTLALTVLLATALYSCSDDTETPTITGDKVKANFTAGIAATTRVSDVIWDVNDAIGIAMLDRQSKDIHGDIFNLRYYTTTSAGDFTPATPSSIIYFPQNGDEVTFKAYYPFRDGLQRNMLIPVSVADQSSMSAIDFMSAEHLAGFSKNDPNVSLEFHHRLSKVIFKLTIADGVSGLLPEDVNLSIKGMKTTGSYDLLNERLIVDDSSVADIAIPLRGTKAERTGIVLPRAAGEGITFSLTSENGSQFEAPMADDLSLDPGYKYTFNVTLEGTKVSISVTVEDWVEGPTTSYDMLGITTPVQDSYGVSVGDQMQVYMQNGNAFDDFRVFTYGSDGKWTTPNPAYWDEITHDPINLRATMIIPDDVAAKAASMNQIPDILIANPMSVERNHGADFIFNHAGSRVTVELQSNIFTADELNNATITLPSYFIGGKEEKGVFVAGTARGNVTVDRTDLADSHAIIQPQSVSPDAALVTVRIGTKDYTARTTSDGFLYEAGVAYKLVVAVNESDVSVSATVVDWVTRNEDPFEILEVTSSGTTTGIEVGTLMTVYKKGDDSSYSPWVTYGYAGNNRWTPDTPVYWKDVPGRSADLRASVLGASKLNSTQVDDWLIADDLHADATSGANFTLRHATSKVTVILLSDVFSAAELNTATITLPQYTSGGTEENGSFVPGNALIDVLLTKTETQGSNGVYYQTGLIQPQTRTANSNIFKISMAGGDFWAKAPTDGFTYAAGVNYGIVIHINEDGIHVSAQVIDWVDQTIELNAFTIGTQTPDASSGVENGELMDVFTGNSTTRNKLATFTYNKAADSWTATPNVFWDNISGTPTFYASIFRAAKLNSTQLDDYLIATPLNPNPANKEPLNFVLRHAAAKVVVQLKSEDGTFSATELGNMQITLPGYLTEGSYNNGLFDYPGTSVTGTITVEKVNNTATAIIRPQTAIATRTVVNINDPATGRDYPVTNADYGDIKFEAGKSTILVINMQKTKIEISANAIDWEAGSTVPLVAPSITIGGILGTTSDFFKGKTIHSYIYSSTGFMEVERTYAENPEGSGAYSWTGAPLYWNDFNNQPLNVTGAYYPSNKQPTISAGVTTFAWDLPVDQSTIADPYSNYDLLMSNMTISSPIYVNLNFKHVLSKVRIELISGEFTQAELTNATVLLNNFMVKGSASLTTGTATAAGTKEATVIPQTDADGKEYSALVMPQTIPSGTRVVGVQLANYPGQTFPGVLTSNLTFAAGKVTVITITLKKTKVDIYATLEDWTDGDKGGIIIQ